MPTYPELRQQLETFLARYGPKSERRWVTMDRLASECRISRTQLYRILSTGVTTRYTAERVSLAVTRLEEAIIQGVQPRAPRRQDTAPKGASGTDSPKECQDTTDCTGCTDCTTEDGYEEIFWESEDFSVDSDEDGKPQ